MCPASFFDIVKMSMKKLDCHLVYRPIKSFSIFVWRRFLCGVTVPANCENVPITTIYYQVILAILVSLGARIISSALISGLLSRPREFKCSHPLTLLKLG